MSDATTNWRDEGSLTVRGGTLHSDELGKAAARWLRMMHAITGKGMLEATGEIDTLRQAFETSVISYARCIQASGGVLPATTLGLGSNEPLLGMLQPDHEPMNLWGRLARFLHAFTLKNELDERGLQYATDASVSFGSTHYDPAKGEIMTGPADDTGASLVLTITTTDVSTGNAYRWMGRLDPTGDPDKPVRLVPITLEVGSVFDWDAHHHRITEESLSAGEMFPPGIVATNVLEDEQPESSSPVLMDFEAELAWANSLTNDELVAHATEAARNLGLPDSDVLLGQMKQELMRHLFGGIKRHLFGGKQEPAGPVTPGCKAAKA